MVNFNSLVGFDIISSLAKIFFLVVSFMSIVFLVVVFRQVISMNTLVHEANDSFILKFFAFILIILSISLFFAALVIL